jgi:hypothetical protein
VQAYQVFQYMASRGGIFLGKWRSSFAGISDSKMNVQSACALNTRYVFSGILRPVDDCQKTEIFILTDMKTPNPAFYL